MKTILVLIALMNINFLIAQEVLTVSDLERLNATAWEGELMYLNYSDNREVKIPTTLQIKVVERKVTLHTQYTNESSKNEKNTLVLSKDGSRFGKEKIIEKQLEPNGDLTIITYSEGTDNNRAAEFLRTYQISSNTFIITKKVSYKDTGESFVRNRYHYTKI